ncbi:MAG: hypothetical protein ABDH21_04980 [bacterium]
MTLGKLGFLIFVVISLAVGIGCIGCCGFNPFQTRYYTVFQVDPETEMFIPISYRGTVSLMDVWGIVERVTKQSPNSISITNNVVKITFPEPPDAKTQYDAYIMFYSLYLSMFYSFNYRKIYLYDDDKVVIIKGIEFVLDSVDKNKYPINNFFKLRDSTQGKYFIYLYDDKYLVVILLPLDADMQYYFKSISTPPLNKLKLKTFDRHYTKFFSIEKYGKDYIDLSVSNIGDFIRYFFDRSILYSLFHNSDLRFVRLHCNFMGMRLTISLTRPSNFGFTRYPLNIGR